MTAHKASIRVARSQRMIAELGHADILDALAHAEEMRTALRVIHTWAGVPGALDARRVRELTAKALHMPSNALVNRRRSTKCGGDRHRP